MIKKIANELKKKGINEICLDSGYKTAQKIWTQKFGKWTLVRLENNYEC
jgi:hypothetical protein